jgi:hypothetical protein
MYRDTILNILAMVILVAMTHMYIQAELTMARYNTAYSTCMDVLNHKVHK